MLVEDVPANLHIPSTCLRLWFGRSLVHVPGEHHGIQMGWPRIFSVRQWSDPGILYHIQLPFPWFCLIGGCIWTPSTPTVSILSQGSPIIWTSHFCCQVLCQGQGRVLQEGHCTIISQVCFHHARYVHGPGFNKQLANSVWEWGLQGTGSSVLGKRVHTTPYKHAVVLVLLEAPHEGHHVGWQVHMIFKS